VHLLGDSRRFQAEIAALQAEVGVRAQTESELGGEVIKLKFQAENIAQSYNSLNTRLANLQGVVGQLRGRLAQTVQLCEQVGQEKERIERKSGEYQERLLGEIERFEEQQFKAN
jgi:predicted  nucleic acid-binding Zn-ribbon protein